MEEINDLLMQSREEQITPIYAELISNRNEFARLLGYDNYLDYCYTCEYNRDYASDDVKAMLDSIYELCAPLLNSATDSIGDASLQNPLEMNGEEMLKKLDVYSEYLKDPKTGWDKYTQLTHVSPDMKYVEAVAACGLHDMTKEENIRQVMETLNSHYRDELTGK